jgi:archaellum component FlaF (FlaF/FlaG flagellin family)
MRGGRIGVLLILCSLAIFALVLTPSLYAGNEVMGEIQFEGRSKVEKTSGVWVDGNYVGFLKELKGSKKVLLLPGEHVISVRQNGYQEFTQRVAVQPGKKYLVRVEMEKAPTAPMPTVTATVKVVVTPNRAAVFVDGQFVGHVDEFDGAHQGMLVVPGAHKITIALPGYQSFETEITAQANQKVEVKTNLVKSGGATSDPLLGKERNEHAAPPPPPEPAAPPQR